MLCLVAFLLFLQLPTAESLEEFLVIGPSDPIIAVVGDNIKLPCRVFPAMNAENMELRWFRSKLSEAVYIYQNHQEEMKEQLAQYRGRTSLETGLLSQGEGNMHIHKVQVSDAGKYTCFFRKEGFFEEAGLELKVVGVNSAPQVHITGPEEDGVRVVCRAAGWFPKPYVQWRDSSGGKSLAFSETQVQDAEGLFSVEAVLVVRDSAVGNVTCSILNPILGQEKAMAIFIPEPFFPKDSPWKLVFVVCVTLLTFLVLGAAYYTWRERSIKVQERQQREKMHPDKEKDEQAKRAALKAIGELQASLDQRKTEYLAAWRKAHLYADWRKDMFQNWPVTLDPGSASPGIVVCQKKASLTLKDTAWESEGRCSILGLEGITSGRCCWEVEIRKGDRSLWALGVCREDVKRTGWYQESPHKGFWVVGNSEDGFKAFTTPLTALSLRQFPHRVGVFLDPEEGDVSFYNMTNGSHIFSFSQTSFSGTLFPYFMIYSGDVSLSICSVVGGPELPVHIKSFPFSQEEPVSSDSSVDGVPPGPKSPLLVETLRMELSEKQGEILDVEITAKTEARGVTFTVLLPPPSQLLSLQVEWVTRADESREVVAHE
ncbi:butyrophilin-like protein 1 [Sorex fumeus]|uniref:butyrophilin-like protein 1 n=1 Tax=Sorex fumeus TaxID=62283 RepID=UPI0024ACEC0C|nr:butyrophilin-like protein 1 [Sorex fumeus]